MRTIRLRATLPRLFAAFAAFTAFVASTAACAVPDEDRDAETLEQGLAPLDPILGHLDGTTPGPDFHAEELPPAQFPFAWSGERFPRSSAVPGTLGGTVTLGPGAAYRAVAYEFEPGAEIEICAKSDTAKAKLWLYTTTSRLSSVCTGFTCNDPDELDETPRAEVDGAEVCTRGRIPVGSWGPHYVIVSLGPGSAAATAIVRTRAIELRTPVTSDPGPFSAASCQGAKLTVGDVEGLGLARGAISSSVGTFETAARTRMCHRFRGCTPWQPVDTTGLGAYGSCSGCIPRQWSTSLSHGELRVAWDDVSFGPYANVLFYPAGSQATAGENHVSCDLKLTYLPPCAAAGNWESWLALDGKKLSFARASESAFTTACVRTIARTPRPKLHSEYEDTEVVFHGDISM